jgi:alpha-galactosidase
METRRPDFVTVATENGPTQNYELAFVTDGSGLRIEFSSAELVTEIRLRWHQPQPIRARILGDHWERGYGDLEWRGHVPERVFPWYALVHNLESGLTSGYGVQTGGAAIAHWKVDPTGVTLTLDIRSGAKGVALNHRSLTVSTVVFLSSERDESLFEFSRRFCRTLCSAPRLPKFPVYGGNDWYYAYGNNSADSIRRDAALIRDHSPSTTNAPFMVIDAGWFPAEGCGGGPYDHGNGKFPDMPGLAAEMEAMNVRPGIWIRPLLINDAPATWQLPENHPMQSREKGVVLDPSVPEVLDLVRRDITRLVEWGYDLIKHDFTTFDITGRWGFEMTDRFTGGNWSFADRSRTTAEIIGELYKTIRQAAGEAILIGCNTVGHLGAGLFELQRTGDDTSGREWERTRKMGINTLAFRMPQHDAFFAVDADCVGLTNDVPWELNRQWLDLLARSGTPLFVSADPAAVGAAQSAALREAFSFAATVQPVAEPMDWLDTTCPSHWQTGTGAASYDWFA